MGARLVPAGGATFRLWAPAATHVYVVLGGANNYVPRSSDELVKNVSTGHWTGYFPQAGEGTLYRYWIAGPGGSGLKRDPYAREIEMYGWPDCDCMVRNLDSYPWHDQNWRTPAFPELLVYQLHIGVFYARDDQGHDLRHHRVSKFLDLLGRIEYLADIGVTAIQPLPVTEMPGEWSLGYNGFDLFSPEMDYAVDPAHLAPYLAKANALLQAKGKPILTSAQLAPQINQLKALIDICHLYGLAFIADVVYNHAGGSFDAQSVDYLDFPALRDALTSIYFSDKHSDAGGKAFDYAKPEVRQFLIDNAVMFLREYHVDGLRFDEVSQMDRTGGWSFCQELTNALRQEDARRVKIAEYWNNQDGGAWRYLAVTPPPQGMGFDVGYADQLRDVLRKEILPQVAGGSSRPVALGRLRNALERPKNYPDRWRAYNCLENHDLVLDMDGDHRKPRIAQLGDWNDRRSPFARGRARAAMGLLLAAPGIPMIFMGQEFLEDKLWSDNPNLENRFIWWDGVNGADPHMVDFHHFTRELLWLRRKHPALRGEGLSLYHVNEFDRVFAFQRWAEGVGRDVLVVITFREQPFRDFSYRLGFPHRGFWHEVFNGDVFDDTRNPNRSVHGNLGGVTADGGPADGLGQSAGITIPAHAVLVFARDRGDS